MWKDKLVLFQRGNGAGRVNALVFISQRDFISGFREENISPSQFDVEFVDLGDWEGARLTFTDGFGHRDKLIFSAAAERTDSTYNDGEIVGSVIGVWDGRQARVLGRLPNGKSKA